MDKAYEVIEGGFGRGEELEADEKGIVIANTVGDAPQGMNGFFASHPETKERVDKMTKDIAAAEIATIEPVSYARTRLPELRDALRAVERAMRDGDQRALMDAASLLRCEAEHLGFALAAWNAAAEG